jgi:anti-sigma factor RsiW
MTYIDLRCDQLVELLTDYLEGALDTACHTDVERHIESCEGCANYLDQMRETIHQIGRLRVEDIPTNALDELLTAFQTEHPE